MSQPAEPNGREPVTVPPVRLSRRPGRVVASAGRPLVVAMLRGTGCVWCSTGRPTPPAPPPRRSDSADVAAVLTVLHRHADALLERDAQVLGRGPGPVGRRGKLRRTSAAGVRQPGPGAAGRLAIRADRAGHRPQRADPGGGPAGRSGRDRARRTAVRARRRRPGADRQAAVADRRPTGDRLEAGGRRRRRGGRRGVLARAVGLRSAAGPAWPAHPGAGASGAPAGWAGVRRTGRESRCRW